MITSAIVSKVPEDPRLFELFCRAVDKGLEYVRLAESGKIYIANHSDWPELLFRENGLPYVYSTDGPRNYGDAIRDHPVSMYGLGAGDPVPEYRKEEKFLALVEYTKSQPRLSEYFQHEKPNDRGSSNLHLIVAGLIDRYVHVNKTTEMDRSRLLPDYLKIEKCLLNRTLPVIIMVPILFLFFEPVQFSINESISIERLSKELHLACGYRGPFSGSGNTLIESAATHGLFLSNCELKNENWMQQNAVMSADFYPVPLIDTLFAAIRISTGFQTGYAQMLTLPVGWASFFTADLAQAEGPSVENHPRYFDFDAGPPTITSGETDGIRSTFENLQRALLTKHAGRVRLAMDRLNLSSLRTRDEDGVIDAMIAMEALLSDGAQEMTHKVAMRLGALYKIADPARSEQAFKELKDVYRFRSMIVHGEANLDKHREIDRGGETIPAVDAAVEHLRNAFSVLIKHPSLLDPKQIDAFLLTGNF